MLWLPSNYNLTMLTLVAWHGVAVTPHSAWASHVSPLSGIHFRLLSPVSCQAQDRATRSRVTEKYGNTQISLYYHKLTWVGKFVDCSRLEAPAHRVDTGIEHFNVINFVFIFELDTIDNRWRADHWAVISNGQALSPGPPMVTCVVTEVKSEHRRQRQRRRDANSQHFPFFSRIRCGSNYEKIRAENVKIIIVFTMRADAAWESGLGTGTEWTYWSRRICAGFWLVNLW